MGIPLPQPEGMCDIIIIINLPLDSRHW